MEDKIKVEFFFDYISPYSYLGFEIISAHQKLWKNMDLIYKPTSLGKMGMAIGSQSSGKVAVKGHYITRDLYRMISGYYKLPFKMYKKYYEFADKGSDLASIVTMLALKYYPEKSENLMRNIFKMCWVTHEDINDINNIEKACLNSNFTKDEALNLIIESKLKKNRDIYNKQTEHAISCGAFGVPSFIADIPGKKPMVFFGSDRIFLLAHFLNEKFYGNEIVGSHAHKL